MAARKLGPRSTPVARTLGGPNHSAGRPFSHRCRSNAANFRVIAERNEFGLTQSPRRRGRAACQAHVNGGSRFGEKDLQAMSQRAHDPLPGSAEARENANVATCEAFSAASVRAAEAELEL